MSNESLTMIACLSTAIWLLGSDSPTWRDIDHAEQMLNFFHAHAAFFFGESHLVPPFLVRMIILTTAGRGMMTLNTHVLCSHAAESVRNFGPHWAYACWALESMGGSAVQSIKGTTGPIQQVRINPFCV